MEAVNKWIHRGPRPQLTWLSENQFARVVNLQSGVYEVFHQDEYEAYQKYMKNVFNLSVTVHNYQLSDIFAPSVTLLRTIADFLHTSFELEQRTYVHCKHGVDRTGMVIAAYRILHCGFTVQEAKNEMYRLGFHRVPYQPWVSQLDKLKI